MCFNLACQCFINVYTDGPAGKVENSYVASGTTYNLTDGDNQLTGKGFVPYKKGITSKDFYIRNGNRFSVVWHEAGYLNFNTTENPEQSNPNVEIPEIPSEAQ